MPERRLERSESNRVIAGVCGGIGAWLGSDPTWVRIAWVVITLLTSVLPMVVIYVLLAAILPTERGGAEPTGQTSGTARNARPPAPGQVPGRPPPPAAGPRSRPDWAIVFGLALLGVGVLLLVAQFVPVRWDVVWPVSLIGLGIVVIIVALRPRTG